jgi:GNAT superfamily N-acetyltransferase
LAAALDLEIRPVRPEDKIRVEEISRGVWDGHDYLPEVFDDWVADPASSFQAAELDGTVVGVQRTRPLASGLAWYEGLRVDAANRRQGIARAMLRSAIEEARAQGFRVIRLRTGGEDATALFESEGFERRLEAVAWRATRLEGEEPARIPDPSEAELLASRIREAGALERYAGVHLDSDGDRDLDADELRRLAGLGRLRAGPGGRALAIVRQNRPGTRLRAGFVSGQGGVLRDLLLALRFEADIDGLEGVDVWLPAADPRAGVFEEVGYDFRVEPFSMSLYALKL